jgi:hypothetical protein
MIEVTKNLHTFYLRYEHHLLNAPTRKAFWKIFLHQLVIAPLNVVQTLEIVLCSSRDTFMTSYSGIRPTSASCVCSVKKRKEIFLSGIRPKCSGIHSYSIQKRSIYERFEETVYPEEIKF